MAIRVALNHRTEYRYDRLVTLSPQLVRLRPAPQCRAPIRSYSLRIEPAPHFVNWQQDPHSNHLARVVFPEPVRHFVVEVDLVAEISVVNPFDFFLEEGADHAPFVYDAWLAKELAAFLEAQPAGPLLAGFVASVDRRARRRRPARVRGADLAEIATLEAGDDGEQRTGLAALLAELGSGIPALAEALNHAYLSHAMPRRQPVGVRAVRPRA